MKHKFTFLTLLVLSLCSMPALGNDKELMNKITASYEKISKSFNCKSITVFSLKKSLDNKEKIILVDIREPEEQKVSMLPNAITEEQFLKNIKMYLGKKIVAYCTIGYRSGKFAEKHKKMNILNLEGGVLAWSHLKGKFLNDKTETNKVHIYSKEWDFLNSNYKAVYK